MKKRLKQLISIVLGAVLLVGGSGCTGMVENKNQNAYLELVNSPATTLDNVWYNPGGIFRCAVFESLLTTNADMTEISEALAKEYKVSEDGLEYTFTLRNNVKWHDGEILDAEDVMFSVKTVLRSEEINGIFNVLKNIAGGENYSEGKSEELPGVTVDGNQITFRLSSPAGDFLQMIAQFAILPEHLLGTTAPNDIPASEFWKKPVGCGCYKVTEAVEGEYFILEANKEYYGKKPGIAKLRIRLNEKNYVQAMEEGRLDFYVTNDPEEIAKMKGLENCSAHPLHILFPTYLIWNLSEDEGVNEDLKDVRVRKALLLAIDRETIVEAVFPGSSVTDTLVPSWDSSYLTNGEDYSYNPEAAKNLLEEAGFDFSKTIRLCYSAKGQSTKDLMDAIAVYWRALGISVEVTKFDGSGSNHMFNIRDYDICYKRLSAFDQAAIYDEVQSSGVMQTKLYNMPVYDELISRLQVTGNSDARREIIRELQKLDQQYLLRLPLFALANIAYVNDARFVMPEAYGNLWYRYNLRFDEWELTDNN